MLKDQKQYDLIIYTKIRQFKIQWWGWKYWLNAKISKNQPPTKKKTTTETNAVNLVFCEQSGIVRFSIQPRMMPSNPRKTNPMTWTLDLLMLSLIVQNVPVRIHHGVGDPAPNDLQNLFLTHRESSPAKTETSRARMVLTTTPPTSTPCQIVRLP